MRESKEDRAKEQDRQAYMRDVKDAHRHLTEVEGALGFGESRVSYDLLMLIKPHVDAVRDQLHSSYHRARKESEDA